MGEELEQLIWKERDGLRKGKKAVSDSYISTRKNCAIRISRALQRKGSKMRE